ncbi:MAG TPA: recombinase family protein [Streptosporangiaceae bacterium]|nr:recombinase family protein [Streptosporangiaceae bacterium]
MPAHQEGLSAHPGADGGGLDSWARATGRGRWAEPCQGGLRSAFYGRVSTEDHQDPVTSRARQLDLAAGLVAGYGRIVAEFFDAGQSRTLPWAHRPQAAALVAAMADPDRGFDAIVVGEYDRAFYGGQYTQMAPLFEHYGIQLWTPEAGGPVDFQAADHELLMVAMGLASKREITRTRIRVRTAMAAQTREQGRYLGGRPPYGYLLADGVAMLLIWPLSWRSMSRSWRRSSGRSCRIWMSGSGGWCWRLRPGRLATEGSRWWPGRPGCRG